MRKGFLFAFLSLILLNRSSLSAWDGWRFWQPEQQSVQYRDPSELPSIRIAPSEPPITVYDQAQPNQLRRISLDDAIRVALDDSVVVRILTGVTASSSGSTVYDPSISTTEIDRNEGRFDPLLAINNSFSQTETAQGVARRSNPAASRIGGFKSEDYIFDTTLSKLNSVGGTSALSIGANRSRSSVTGLPLNPQTRSDVELSYVQPLLQGGGREANLAPIVVARINAERSFFQMKGSVQQLVQGVIEAYWNLVFARTDVWAREQQVTQGKEAFELAQARRAAGIGDLGDVAQSQTALANFEAALIAARANRILRETALRNILGLGHSQPLLVPTTPPWLERVRPDWQKIVELASDNRPDLIELKLILEADEQQLLIAKNNTLPSLNANALYRWNGLEGTAPNRSSVASRGGDFTDWQLGINFSVPLGLRQARADRRRQELVLERDRANIRQGLHNASHLLAIVLRNLASTYEQYLAFKRAREAARVNLDQQLAEYRIRIARPGEGLLLNVLSAITTWGDSVSAESQTLIQYNIELANLELQTGTILETHGIRFFEERFCSAGPLRPLKDSRQYSESLRPFTEESRYPSAEDASETIFDLRDPLENRKKRLSPPENPPKPRPSGVRLLRPLSLD